MFENMADGKVIKVGSRKSQLALIQTEIIINKLKEHHPEKVFEIVTMSTIGDKILDAALSKIGEKSLFTRELEQALLEKSVDFVVHSLKDLPTSMPDGLAIACVYRRDSCYDAVVMHPKHAGKTLEDLPEGSVIGTSSLRRTAQLLKKFPTFQFENIRGNLNTRLKKLDEDEKYDAIILAEAGLLRMGWANRISQVLNKDSAMYAVGQGAMAVECCLGDASVCELLSCIHDRETTLQCVAERAFMNTLEGGCTVPICVNCRITDSQISMTGAVFSLDASRSKECSCQKQFKTTTENGVHKADGLPPTYTGILSSDVISDADMQVALATGTELANEILGSEAADIIRDVKEEMKRCIMNGQKPTLPAEGTIQTNHH